ncbi:unnamed protein product [Lampetra planeri]
MSAERKCQRETRRRLSPCRVLLLLWGRVSPRVVRRRCPTFRSNVPAAGSFFGIGEAFRRGCVPLPLSGGVSGEAGRWNRRARLSHKREVASLDPHSAHCTSLHSTAPPLHSTCKMAFKGSSSKPRPRSAYGENGSPQTERERSDAIQGTKFRTSVKDDTSWINRAGGLNEDEGDEPGLIDFGDKHPTSPLSPTYAGTSRSSSQQQQQQQEWDDMDSHAAPTKGARDSSGGGFRSSTQKWDSAGPEGSSSFSRVEITETETRRGGRPVSSSSSSSMNEQINVTERKEVYGTKSELEDTVTTDSNKENLWENAWRRCSRCNHALGKRANSYILDYLGLYYHEACFKCDGCDADLGHMGGGGTLHIVAKHVNCDACYQKSLRSGSGR